MPTMLVAVLFAAQDADALRDALREAVLARAATLYAEDHGRAPESVAECLPVEGLPDGLTLPAVGEIPEWLPPLPEPADVRRRLEWVAAAVRAYVREAERFPSLEDLRASLDLPILHDLAFTEHGATLAIEHRPAPPTDDSAALREVFNREIGRLESPQWREREEATEAIAAIGAPALEWIEEALGSRADPEVRSRLEAARGVIQAALRGDDRPPTVFVINAGRRSGSRRAANERSASACMRSMCNAEEVIANTDADGNGLRDYWTGDVAGLYLLDDTGGSTIRVIQDRALADADLAPLRGEHRGNRVYGDEPPPLPQPKSGYFFMAMPSMGSEADPTSGQDYGFCAIPAEYGVTGVDTFIICSDGTVFHADTRGRPVLRFPDDDELTERWQAVW